MQLSLELMASFQIHGVQRCTLHFQSKIKAFFINFLKFNFTMDANNSGDEYSFHAAFSEYFELIKYILIKSFLFKINTLLYCFQNESQNTT